MNLDFDYLVVYVVFEIDYDGFEGYGFMFIIGCGNEICCVVIDVMCYFVVGLDFDWICEDMGCFWWYVMLDS